MRRPLFLTLLVAWSLEGHAGVVFSYPPSPSGGLVASSWVDPNGTDADMYAYDDFTLASTTAITEVDWRGGYIYGAAYGHAFDFSITFYDSIAGGSQPLCTNPQLPEIYLAYYMVGGTAGETPAGVFGGTPMYDYRFVLPTPFQAVAGHKYWVRIEGFQPTYPDWALSVGTGGDGQHFNFSTGASCLATDIDYEIYEGTLGNFASHLPIACSTAGARTASISPAPGDTYYLVAARNASVEGSLGKDSALAERLASTAACRPRGLGACP